MNVLKLKDSIVREELRYEFRVSACKVLLISDKVGKIVKTPLYSAKNNLQNRVCQVNIDPVGTAVAKINTQYSHEQFETIFSQMFREPKDQREYIMQSLTIANPEIINYKYAFPDKSKPELTEEVSLKVSDLMSVGGDKYFLTLNLMNKRSYVPEAVEDRITDFALQMNYTDIDEISYNLPADFKVDFLPKDLNLKSDFGEYSLKISVANNKISYLRTQKMYSKQYPASRYAELIDFYKSIYKADKQKAVLSKI